MKTCANLAFFIWTHELLPLDILLLALTDRDDDPHALRIVVCFSAQFDLVYAHFLILFLCVCTCTIKHDIIAVVFEG